MNYLHREKMNKCAKCEGADLADQTVQAVDLFKNGFNRSDPSFVTKYQFVQKLKMPASSLVHSWIHSNQPHAFAQLQTNISTSNTTGMCDQLGSVNHNLKTT